DPRFRRIAGSSGTDSGWLRVPAAAKRGSRWGQEINEIAERYGVDSTLVHAVIDAESAFNPWAVSRKGAQGLMQLMPRTASAPGGRAPSPRGETMGGGAPHLPSLTARSPGRVPRARAAYTAGGGAVASCGGSPPYPETQQYVQRILQRGGSGSVAAPGPAPQVIYRSEDSDGTLVFSNIPPTTGVRRAR